jgi:hypothetical protein
MLQLSSGFVKLFLRISCQFPAYKRGIKLCHKFINHQPNGTDIVIRIRIGMHPERGIQASEERNAHQKFEKLNLNPF